MYFLIIHISSISAVHLLSKG